MNESILQKIAEAEYDKLISKSFAELSALEPMSNRPSDENKKYRLGIWKEEMPTGELRVVVQAYRPYILGISTVYGIGFEINRDGATRTLSGLEIDGVD